MDIRDLEFTRINQHQKFVCSSSYHFDNFVSKLAVKVLSLYTSYSHWLIGFSWNIKRAIEREDCRPDYDRGQQVVLIGLVLLEKIILFSVT